MTQSLGEMLRNKIATDEAHARAERQRVQDEAEAKRQRELDAVQEFFNNAKNCFIKDIVAGRQVKAIKVGRGENENIDRLLETYSLGPENPMHKYHSVWASFAQWAADNGLKPVWAYEHDGCGMYSWHMLSVQPL